MTILVDSYMNVYSSSIYNCQKLRGKNKSPSTGEFVHCGLSTQGMNY